MSNNKYIISHRGTTPTVKVKLKDGRTIIMNANEVDIETTAEDTRIDTASFVATPSIPSVDGFQVSYNHTKITPGSTVTLNFGLVNPSGEDEFEFQPIAGDAFVDEGNLAFSIKRNGSKARVQDVDRSFRVRDDATADDDASITIVPHNDAARAVASHLTQDEATFHFAFVAEDAELLAATKSDVGPEVINHKAKENKNAGGKNKGKAGNK